MATTINSYLPHKYSRNLLNSQASDETYGLGWRRAGHQARKWHFGPYASPRAYGHTGWTGTVTVIDPEYDLAIVLLTNARHTPIEGSIKIMNLSESVSKQVSMVQLSH